MRSENVDRFIPLKLLLLLLTIVPQGFPEASTGDEGAPALIRGFDFKNASNQTVVTIQADHAFDYSSYYPNPHLFILDIPAAQSGLDKNFLELKTPQVDFVTVTQIGEGYKYLIRLEFNLLEPIQYSLHSEGASLRLVLSSLKLTGSNGPGTADEVAASASNPAYLGVEKQTYSEKSRVSEHPKGSVLEQTSTLAAKIEKNDIAIHEDEEKIEFILQTSGRSTFNHFELNTPDRIVIDAASGFKVSRQSVKLKSDLIQKVRFGYGESEQGRLVRCVFDLARRSPYDIATTDSGIVVRFLKRKALAQNKPRDEKMTSPPGNNPLLESHQEWIPTAPLGLDARPLVSELLDNLHAVVIPKPLAMPVTLAAFEGSVASSNIALASKDLAISGLNDTPGVPELLPPIADAGSSLSIARGPEVLKLTPLSLEVREPAAFRARTEVQPDSEQERPVTSQAQDKSERNRPTTYDATELIQTDAPSPAIEGRLTLGAEPFQVAQLVSPPPILAAPAPKSRPAALTPPTQPPPAVTTAPVPSPIQSQASTPGSSQVISQVVAAQAPRYTGEPISLELKDADIKDFFRLIGEISGLNIVLDPDVKGALTIFLNDVPWDQALDVVLKNNSLGKQLEGNVLRIASNATLEAEETQRKRLADARVLAAELQTETRVLSYAKAADLSAVLKKILSPRGDIIVDARTNSMIISDIPGKFPAIDALIKQLDKKIKQVEIEARVIAATRDFLRDIGVQIGMIVGNNAENKLSGAIPGNPFTRSPPPSVTIQPGQSGGAPDALPLISNLGANAATSGLAFFGGFNNNFILDTIITAAERRGSAKLISKPKIITQDNIQGFVQQGVKIPVQTTINNTVSVQFFDFALKLEVTPQITEEGTIMLNVKIENSTPDFSRQVLGVPTVNTQETRTTVLVNSGGTVVVGGVLIDNEQVNIRQVPGIGSIPVIGNLFKNRSVNKQTQELIFFLSPKIL